MTQDRAPPTITSTREERLAAKLRENLRRRKAQSRELQTRDLAQEAAGETQNASGSENESVTLPKSEPKS